MESMQPDALSLLSVATRYQKGKQYFIDRVNRGDIPICSPGFVRGGCRSGHRFAHIQFCGKEYCRDCSMDGSPIHQRRVRRWWGKVQDWEGMSYLVVTIPEDYRFYFFNKETLRHFRFSFLRFCKRQYKWKSGVARYHWFGDCPLCNGGGCEICNETGSGDYWHPHLNILVPGMGYIEDIEEYLKPARIFIAKYLRKLVDESIMVVNDRLERDPYDEESCELLDYYLMIRRRIRETEMNVNYSYVKSSDKAMMMNRVKYVTRSTFRRFDEETKDVLHGFRNAIVWGWKKSEDIECSEDDGLVMEKYCPHCLEQGIKEKIHWSNIDGYKHNQFIKPIYKIDETTGKRRQTAVFTIKEPGGDPGNSEIDRDYSRIRINRIEEKTSWGRFMSKSLRHPIL